MSDLSIDIDKSQIPVETTNKDNNSKPHNGDPILLMEISPHGKYLVTYSGNVYDYEERKYIGDNSVVGWNIDNIDEGQLKPDNVYYIENIKKEKGQVEQICVSDDKKLACRYGYELKIIDMNNNNKEINLYFDERIRPFYCTFNLKGEFILYSRCVIWIYSTKTTKNNKWNCKKIYKLPFNYYNDNFRLVSISKYDKLYLFSYLNSYIYEWDILTEKCIKLFGNDEIKKLFGKKQLRDLEIHDHIRISSNRKFICLKIEDKIIIYSIELETPIVSLNNNDIQLYNDLDSDFDLYCLLLTSFDNRQITKHSDINNDNKRTTSSEIMEYYCKEYLGHLKQSPKEYQTENLPILFDNNRQITKNSDINNDNKRITSSEIMEYCRKEYLGHLKQSPKEYQTENLFDNNRQITKNSDINNDNERITSSEIMEYYCKEYFGHLKQSPKEYQTENLPILFDNNRQITKNSDINNDNERITSSEIMEYCRKEYFGHLKQSLKEYQTENLPILFDNISKFVFGILGGYVRKIKLEEKINFSFEKSVELNNKNDKIIEENSDELNENDKIIESWNIYLDNECDNHLNIHLFNPYMVTIHKLFQEIIPPDLNNLHKQELELTQDLIKIKVNINEIKNLVVQVFKKNNVNSEWDLICEKNDNNNFGKKNRDLEAHGIKLCNDNDIVILTSIGLFIYHFNESSKFISLNYFYHVCLHYRNIQDYYEKVFSKSTLPLPNYESFKCSNGWISSVIDNKLRLLKYGVELLSFVIQEHKLELIDDIYKKCINYFKQDLNNNRMFLNIITSTMPILNEYYPEYILRYSLETTMIIDSPFYSIEHQNNDLHLYSFSQYPQIVNLSRSILWTKYAYLFYSNNGIMFHILIWIQLLIILLTFPISFPTFCILLKYHFINGIYKGGAFSRFYFYIFDKISSKFTTTPTITFMIPYIKFVNYPQDYNWFLDFIRPKSSPFVKTINRDIYKTWSGEALINFKWNTYGKYYYAIIWIIFMALFGCFTTAATITLVEDVRNKFLVASIIFGFIHLLTEVRQIIYDPKKWVLDLWNIFDIIAYLFPICTSIYWLKTNNMITWLLSFSCLFLDIKFLMFFRVFESFGVYFAIIISVGKQIISFLVVLLIIIMSFAHAFYILLLPRSDNDPNSPLNLATTYNKVLGDGTIDPNPSLIQPPGDNTNMFVDYRTSILAMYLFLAGDSSSLTNWSYTKNPPLALLIVIFSFLVVVYLMNLFIGLLNIAIEQDNNRVSYLIEKAKILAEIELFYLLPNQRRWHAWFPDIIHYYANVDKTREKINEMINKEEWKTNNFPLMKRDLLNKLNIQHNPNN